MKLSRSLIVIASLASAACSTLAQTTQPTAGYLPYAPIVVPEPPRDDFIKPRTVQLIDDALKRETDSALRVRLASDLGQAKSPESIPVLKRLLADADPLVRTAAVRSLATIGAGDAATFSPLIKDASPTVRREVVLSKLEPAILAGVTDADPSVQAAALSVSVSDATDAAIAGSLDKLDPTLQALASRTLASRGATSASASIARLLQSPSVVTRVAALEALTALKTATAPQVQEQIKHAHPAVRVAAIKAAAVLPETADRVSAASTGIADADLAVRVPASTLLGALGDPASAPLLGQQLAKGYEPLHLSARAALVALVKSNPAAQSAVESVAGELLANASPARRIDGSIVLGQIKSTHALPAHIALLNDADWTVVRQAAISLGLIGDKSASEPIMQTLARSFATPAPADQDAAVGRVYAAEQLILAAAALRHTPVLDAIKPYPLDIKTPIEVRTASMYAIGVLASPEQAASSLRAMLGRTNSQEESSAAISEAIRAFGNARAKSMVGPLKKVIESNGGEYGYVAHLAIDQINGETTPFIQEPVRFEAETAIQAVDP